MSLKEPDVHERFCSAVQSLFSVHQLRLLGFEIYKVVAQNDTAQLIELRDPDDLRPHATFMVVVSYEKEGRWVEFHAKYHLTEDRDLVEDFFQVMSSDIYPGENPREVEVSSVPDNLRPSTVGVMSELIKRLQRGTPNKGGVADPTS